MQADQLARASRLEAFAAQDPGNSDLLLDLAQAYHRAGKHLDALRTLERLPQGPTGPALALKGQLLLSLGRWMDAAQLYLTALESAPESAALWFNLGYALWAAGGSEQQAVHALRRASALAPEDTHILRHLAMALDAANDRTSAIAELNRAVDAGHGDAALLVLLSQLQLDTGDVVAARNAAARAVTMDPGSPAAWQARGQVALFELDGAAAHKALQQALDLDPQDDDTRVMLAQAVMMLGRPQLVRRLLAPAIDRHDADAQALCLAGWAFAAEDDAAGAKRCFERACAAEPELADGWAGLGCVQLAQGATEDARASAGRALSLEPAHPVGQLIQDQLDSSEASGGAPGQRLAALLNSTPFGPWSATLGQSLTTPAVQHAAIRLRQRQARLVRRAGRPSADGTGPAQ